jgi:hypothetical protein
MLTMTRQSSRQRLLSEPIFDASVSPDEAESVLERCLYWYRENFKPASAREWVADYLKANGNPDGAKVCHRGSKSTLRILAPYCRLAVRGFPLPDAHKENMGKWLGELLQEAERASPPPTEGADRPNVQDRVKAKADGLLCVLEPVIDASIDCVQTGKAKQEPLVKWVRNTEMTGPIASIICERLRRTAADLRAACDGTDPDLVEGYSYMKPKQLEQLTSIFETSVQVIQDRMGVMRTMRKPRKRKVKPPEQQVKKLNYLPKCDQSGLVSVVPSGIVGAQGLIVYNTLTRTAKVLVAVEPKTGLQVKGSTVIGVDSNKSFEKRLRKPDDFLSNKGGCRKTFTAAVRYLSALKTKTAEANGRINKHCLILQVQQ